MQLIYAAVNKINNKVYIGKTKRGIHIRALDHFKSAKRGSKTAFHNAIRKYGEDAFTWYVLQDNIDDSLIDSRERYWIARYKQLGYTLYNLTDGGDGGKTHHGPMSEDACKRMKGNRQPRTQEWKQVISSKNKQRAKSYKLCKDGLCITVENIVDWSRDRGYDYGLVYRMIRGTRKSAYGWRLYEGNTI